MHRRLRQGVHEARSIAPYAGALIVLIASFTLAGAGSASAQSRSRPRANASAYRFDAPTSAAVVGSDLFVANGGGDSVTEINAASGQLVAMVSGKRYRFRSPSAVEAIGPDLFVANAGGNSVTEFDASTLKRVRVIHRHKAELADPVALASSGQELFVLNGNGSVTEISSSSGAVIGTISGPQFGFYSPSGFAVADGRIFVANPSNNTVTVIDATTRALIGILSGPSYGFNWPSGVAFDGTNVWITNPDNNSVTEISPTTLQALNVVVSSNLPWVVPIISGDGYVFTVSPPGSSPMVSQIIPSSATVTWMMCNTNGPYDFNDPEAAVVDGSVLWVVNKGGNSLTEMDAASGALIGTVQ